MVEFSSTQSQDISRGDLLSKASDLPQKLKQQEQQQPQTQVPAPSTTIDKRQQDFLRHVLVSIRNHWLIAAPVVFLRFMASNMPIFSSKFFSPSTIASFHTLTDYLLVLVAVLLILEKFYLISRQVKRPHIPNPLYNFLVRNHWLVLSTIIFGTLFMRSRALSVGFKSVQSLNSWSDLVLLCLGLTMVWIKLGYILRNRIESVASQFNPRVEGNKEKSN